MRVLSSQPFHHRVFWREETTPTSLWEGTNQAIEDALAVKGSKNEQRAGDAGGKGMQLQTQSPTGDNIPRTTRRLSPAATIREISEASDLQRLSRVLNDRRINTSSLDAFLAALQDGNPAVVDMWLRHGKKHKGEHFLATFRAWGKAIGDPDDGTDGSKCGTRSRGLPLHLSCHAGSHEIVAVLLRFMADSYSCEERNATVNARDMNGRTALHLASWSPRLQCPGSRKDIVRLDLCRLPFLGLEGEI